MARITAVLHIDFETLDSVSEKQLRTLKNGLNKLIYDDFEYSFEDLIEASGVKNTTLHPILIAEDLSIEN